MKWLYSKKILDVLDVSVFLMYGNKAQFSKNWNYKGFPTGGLNALMRQCSTSLKSGNELVLAFDSKTDRRMYVPSYNANRVPTNKFGIQVETILPMLERSGIRCLKIENREADDIICGVVNKAFIEGYGRINVYTNDYDMCHLLDRGRRVRMLSPTSKASDVDFENYSYVLNGIPYNAVLPWKTLFYDSSDNVRMPKLEGVSSEWAFNNFMQSSMEMLEKEFAGEDLDLEALLSDRVVMDIWLDECKQLTEQDRKTLEARKEIFYPREIDVDLPWGEMDYKKVNKIAFRNILQLFGMNRIAKYMKMELGENTKEQDSFIYEAVKRYKSRELVVDEDIGDDEPERNIDFNEIDTKDF